MFVRALGKWSFLPPRIAWPRPRGTIECWYNVIGKSGPVINSYKGEIRIH